MVYRAFRDVSDTARWMATFRALEAGASEPLFQDEFAERLAGPEGTALLASNPWFARERWSFSIRTYLFDTFITNQVRRGIRTVACLGAGLDARPYRLNLPRSLHWLEVDLPEIIRYKEELLCQYQPRCHVERLPLDLLEAESQAILRRTLDAAAFPQLIVTEGLLIYLKTDEVTKLLNAMHSPQRGREWVLDFVSPDLLSLLLRRGDAMISRAPFLFGLEEEELFFTRSGWTMLESESVVEVARRLNRLPSQYMTAENTPDRRPSPERTFRSMVCLLAE